LEGSLVGKALRAEQSALELAVHRVRHGLDVAGIQEAENLACHVERADRDGKRDHGLAIARHGAGLVADPGAELLAVQLERERDAVVIDGSVVRILYANLHREPKLEAFAVERLDARDADVERIAARRQRRTRAESAREQRGCERQTER